MTYTWDSKTGVPGRIPCALLIPAMNCVRLPVTPMGNCNRPVNYNK